MKFDKLNFNIQRKDNGLYKIMVKEYKFKLIPFWNELTYNENNNVKPFEFMSKRNAEEFLSQFCDI